MVQPVTDDALRDLLTSLTVFDTLDDDDEDDDDDEVKDVGESNINTDEKSDKALSSSLSLSGKDNKSSMLITKELARYILKRAAKVELSNEVIYLLRDIRIFMRDDMDPPVYCR